MVATANAVPHLNRWANKMKILAFISILPLCAIVHAGEFTCECSPDSEMGYLLRFDTESVVIQITEKDKCTKIVGLIPNPGESARYLKYLLEGLDAEKAANVGRHDDSIRWKMTLTMDGQTVTRDLAYIRLKAIPLISSPEAGKGGDSFAISEAQRYKENTYARLAIEFVTHLRNTTMKAIPQTEPNPKDRFGR